MPHRREIIPEKYASLFAYRRALAANLLRQARINYWCFRILQTIAAAILTPVTALTPIFVITYSVFKGRPTRFEMIAKSNAVMERDFA